MTQVLHEELKSDGLKGQVLCPGVVAAEFHERQGHLPAFAAQSPELATRYPAD